MASPISALGLIAGGAYIASTVMSKQNGKGEKFRRMEGFSLRQYGFQMMFASFENPIIMWGFPIFSLTFVWLMELLGYCGPIVSTLPWYGKVYCAFPYILTLAAFFFPNVLWSHFYGEAGEAVDVELQKKMILFKDEELKRNYEGKKIPIEIAIESFQDGKIDFLPDVVTVLRHRYDLFKMAFTFGHIRSLVVDMLVRLWKHDDEADKADISNVYNRGNDFYGWFLCDRMLYSVGLFKSSDEKALEKSKSSRDTVVNEAQIAKLDHICKDYCMMKEGMEHLDLGCGWGAMILHASDNYKVKSTGVTLSQEQANFIATKKNKNVDVRVMNFWALDDETHHKKYDVITCLEMSEHIGIRDYQKFCHKVRSMLKDDGVFYLQIAGLRRAWQYEDCCWALFMNRYVFPGADASMPLYWDIEQLERSGFEIRQVENQGCNYALTIYSWYLNWVENKSKVVAKYSEWSWRNWSIFLAWSYLIAMQGTSTVWQIAMHKQFPNDKRSRAQPINVKSEEENVFGLERCKLVVDKQR